MTWKQLILKVEYHLKSNGIDPDAQPIDITYIEIDIAVTEEFRVVLNTREMPKRCSIEVHTSWQRPSI